jgi:hypothetical protein
MWTRYGDNPGSSVGLVTGYERGQDAFLLSTFSTSALGFTQHPAHLIHYALSQVVNRPCCESDHSLPSSDEVEVKVTLRLTVSQSVCLGVGHPLGPMTRFYFFLTFAGKLLSSSS